MSGAAMFEDRYRTDPDPWRTLTDPAEQAKADDALAACGPGPFAHACELGAGIGGLTVRLAPRCHALTAIDAAPTAVAAAAKRLASWPYAQAVVGAIPDDLPEGPFDLVVASEILYYLSPPGFARTLDWLRGVLVRGGRIVAVHWTGEAPDLRRSADDVGAGLAELEALRPLVAEHRSTYRLDVLERV